MGIDLHEWYWIRKFHHYRYDRYETTPVMGPTFEHLKEDGIDRSPLGAILELGTQRATIDSV